MGIERYFRSRKLNSTEIELIHRKKWMPKVNEPVRIPQKIEGLTVQDRYGVFKGLHAADETEFVIFMDKPIIHNKSGDKYNTISISGKNIKRKRRRIDEFPLDKGNVKNPPFILRIITLS